MSRAGGPILRIGAVVAAAVILLATVLSVGSPVQRPSRTDHVILVEIRNAQFHPGEFHLPQGRRSALYIVNRDLEAHTFVVDQLGVRVTIPSRRSANVLVEPRQAGQFHAYCDDPRHQGSMNATLVVR